MIDQYKAVIFDVDGTLYFQAKLRSIMAFRLFLHGIRNPRHLTDLKIIKHFRHLRENLVIEDEDLSVLQYQVVADHLLLDRERVKSVVERWMYEVPLPYLRACRDEELCLHIQALQAKGISTVAYSDFPVTEKIKALGLTMDFCFSATDQTINCLKPSPRGLNFILKHLSLAPEECLLIGDREEKDGLCARQAGLDYLILSKSPKRRKAVYCAPPFNLNN